jgi:ADP-ribose pyrophosphatase YjhB (NUDIX family)
MKIKAYGVGLYKKEHNCVYILLCKAMNSKQKWGFLKGGAYENETPKQTALREFQEESGICLTTPFLEKYFEQKNETKDVGVFLANYAKIKGIEKYFHNGELREQYLSLENSQAKFFDIKHLPKIKSKQINLVKDVVTYLKRR